MGIPGLGLPSPADVATQATQGNDITGNRLKIEDILKILGAGNPASSGGLPVLTQNTSVVPGLQQPMPQRQYPNVHDSTTGREFQTIGGHKRANVGDIFNNVGEIVKTSQKNKEALQTRALAVDLERLMTAAANPNDPANQQIIVDMMSDPKKAKAIAKALDISFMGEDKRDNVSKGALDTAVKKVGSVLGIGGKSGGTQQGIDPIKLAALKQSQGTDAFGGNMARMLQLPTAVGASPQAQVLEQLAKSGALEYMIPKKGEELKSQTDLAKTLFTNDNKLQIAQILANSKDKNMQMQLLKAMQQSTDKKYQTDVIAQVRKYVADKQADTILKKTQMIEARLKNVQAKGDKELEDMIKQANSLTAQIKQAADQVKNTPANKWYQFGVSDKDTAKDRLGNLQKQFDTLQKQINNKRMTGALNGNTGDRDSTEFTNADDFLNDFKEFNEVTGNGEE